MSFTWRLWILLALMAVCGTGLNLANRSQPAAIEQTLPPAYFGAVDDIQYFPPGPEFKLQREAAAMKAYQSDWEVQEADRDRY
jgi:hypothetical protein